ncbi:MULTISPECIES: lipopolysaccharide biosynthesis protein [Priestia]|uniref:lipopolysaccharide biosynthesis protein n=1 Tax=Priestia TaxID=2800373 RepID=UPI002E1CE729|nr:oligosaccharide flippase family protein [Priestia aryabhattai]MED4023444.1 oligosaccharide flippase family protein [Priestia aryabhattai]
MTREKKLFKNTMIYALGNFSSKGLVFLMLPIYTSFLTPREFGSYDLIVTIVTLLVPIISFQIQEGSFRYIIDEKEHAQKYQVVSSTIQIIVRNLIVSNILYILCISFFNIHYSLLIMVYYNVYIFSEVYLQVARGFQKNLDYAIAGIINTLVNLISTLILTIGFNLKIEGLLISVIFGFITSLVYLEMKIKILKNIKFFNKNITIRSNLVRYSVPLIPNILNWWIMNVSDRLLLTHFMGVEANGIYAIANKFPSIIIIMNSIFYLAWQESAITEYSSKDKDKFYSQMFNGFMKFQVSCLLVLLSLSPIFIYLFVESEFKEAYLYMPFLYMGAVLSSFSSFYGTGFQSAKETKGAFYSSVLGSVLNIILNLLLIPYIGIQGAAISTMLAFLVMWIMRIYQTKKYFRIKIDVKSLLILIVLTIIFTITYFNVENILSQVIFITVSLLTAFLYNKQLCYKLLKQKF